MSDWIQWLTQALWRNGLAVVPMALIVWAIVQWGVSRPATRHVLWLGALVWLLAAVLLRPMAISVEQPETPAENVAALPPMPAPVRISALPRGARRFDESRRINATNLRSHAAKSPTIRAAVPDCDALPTLPPGNCEASCIEHLGYSYVCSLQGRDQNEMMPAIAGSDRSAGQNPTPPTTVARPANHELSSQNAVHDSVGQSSPFWVSAIDVGDEDGGEIPEPPVVATMDAVASKPSNAVAMLDGRRIGVGNPAECCEEPELTAPAADNFEMEPAYAASPESVHADTGQNGLRKWIGAWIRVRDSIGSLPTMPSVLWIGIALLLVAIKLLACLRFQRRLRSARQAPQGVRAMVRACGESIGLKSAPETFFVTDRISPMVVCGLRPRLVIPEALWAELDSAGRRAVILHELAHLRRRDHLTHWFDCLVGALYWWHPVVWWIRHRMRDEAENACDAWVTWFEPRERRAYATALLQARKFLSESRSPVLVPSVGVMSPQATRFSRRLTMVMTNRVSPRACSCGVLAIPFLFLAAWVSMPADSAACPPGSEEDVKPVQLIHSDEEAPSVGVVADAESTGRILEVVPSVVETEAGGSVVLTVSDRDGRGAASSGAGRTHWHQDGHDSDDERIARLERQMAELNEKLSILIEQRPRLMRRSAPPQTASEPILPGAPKAPHALGRAASPAPQAMGLFGQSAGGIVVRKYALPKDKLKLLTVLMSRSDVPTRIRAVPGAIEVHANEADQAKFAAFVTMISGSGMDDTRSYRVSDGKLQALTELMALDDVPVLIHYGDDDIRVQGGELIQKTFRDFVDMIDPDTTRASAEMAEIETARYRLSQPAVAAENALAYARVAKDAERARRSAIESRASSARLHEQIAALQAQMVDLEVSADRMTDEADRLREKADALRERAEDANSQQEAEDLRAAITEITEAASRLDKKAASLYRKAQKVELKADQIEERIESSGR